MARTLGRISIAAVLALAGCGGGGHSVLPAGGSPGSTPLGKTTFSYGAALVANASRPVVATIGTLHLQVMVKSVNPGAVVTYAQEVSTPGSPLYRHFLTPQQLAAQFGASQSDYAAATTYFASMGLAVATYPQRMSIAITGPQSAVEKAFGTHFGVYQTATGPVYAPMSTPFVPVNVPITAARLAFKPSAVHTMMVPVPKVGNNVINGYTPEQIARAFDFDGAYAAGYTGAGINLGIIATGPADAADLTAYEAMYSWPAQPGGLQQINATSAAAANNTLTGGSPTATPPPVSAPGCTGTLPACNPEDGEAQLDTEQALLAKGATTLFYLAYVPNECFSPATTSGPACVGPAEGIQETDDEIQQAIADNRADVLSLSFGGGELDQALYFTDPNTGIYSPSAFGPTEFAELAAEGIATFVSSGDTGAEGCARDGAQATVDVLCVSYPASDQNVTSVGGVTTPLNNAGQLIGPLTAWGLQTAGGLSGSGGGVSAYIPLPSWQAGTNITGSMREQPDDAMEGDPDTGVSLVMNADPQFPTGSESVFPIGGTSVAAPEMAAMWALVLQACKQTPACEAGSMSSTPWRLGNPAPLLYAIYNNAYGTSPAGTQYSSTFYDVTFGNNAVIGCTSGEQYGTSACPTPLPTPDPGYSAGTNYDNVTGIGVPFARHLIQTVVGV